VYTLTSGSLDFTSWRTLEAAHASAVAGGVARAVADAGGVARAVAGVVDTRAVAGVVDAGRVARAVARAVAGVVPGILPPDCAVQEVGGGGGQPLGPGGDVVGHAFQYASHLVGGADQRGLAQRPQGGGTPTDGDGDRAVGPVAGGQDDPGEHRVAPAPMARGVLSAVVIPGILGPPPVGVAGGLRVGVPHLGLQLGREQGHHPLDG